MIEAHFIASAPMTEINSMALFRVLLRIIEHRGNGQETDSKPNHAQAYVQVLAEDLENTIEIHGRVDIARN